MAQGAAQAAVARYESKDWKDLEDLRRQVAKEGNDLAATVASFQLELIAEIRSYGVSTGAHGGEGYEKQEIAAMLGLSKSSFSKLQRELSNAARPSP